VERGFKEAFAALNSRQRQAVENIEGPVMVIAGPGTGKTQLISTRVGNILQKTDTPAEAMLLLTFTEAGVEAMRDRLNRLLGPASYDVNVSTYHAFGGEIFRSYPDYFEGANLRLVEELGADALLREIIAKLPYSDPLKFADSYINDLMSFISEAKRALLSPENIEQVATDNLKFIDETIKSIGDTLNKLSTVSKKTVPVFEELAAHFSSRPSKELPGGILPLVRYAQAELEQALEHFSQTGQTKLLTQWKRHWLAKDSAGNYILDGQRQNQRLKAAGGIYRRYQKRLQERDLYDYDDMILRAIGTLEANPELKYSLAERYTYIMLDEFQDTNPAQFKLVQLLTDHPVHEGRPNVLAVGDDDQAIYSFQGADHANMNLFINHYKKVKIISLNQNYRAWPQLIETSENIVSQIQSRLVNQFEHLEKKLKSSNEALPEPPKITAREFKSDAAQYTWVAEEIKRLIKKGVAAKGIAVLAPKHRFLVPLLPYLVQHKIPVYYERRENILDETLVHQLEQMSRLVLALADGNETLANSLWTEVLSYDFWHVPTQKIWQINWQSRQSHEPWTAILLNDETLSVWASFFIKLATLLPITTLEQQLDALIGIRSVSGELELPARSPMYDYYFSKDASNDNPLRFQKLISDLSVLRSRLDNWRQSQDESIGLRAFVQFIEGHRAAGINILNTSPYHETAEAVNLLTAYGAKGREFQAVFLVAAVDEVWGSSSRNQGYRLSLPPNLNYIRYQGASEDERLRLLYVAVTRARTRLYLTSFKQDLAGKGMTRLKYIKPSEEKGSLVAGVLPAKFKKIIIDESESLSVQAAENYWTQRHIPPFNPELIDVLKPRLNSYKLSATDLNYFINIIDYGPNDFFIKCLLGFRSAPVVNDAFGTALHNSLRFAGNIFIKEGQLPSEKRLIEIFDAQLVRIDLPADEFDNLSDRGHDSLRAWLAQRGKELKPSDRFEYDFQKENSRLDVVRLGGRVDRMMVDEKRRAITVVDYKIGRPYDHWQSNIAKLHMFRHQLLFYKLLIEASSRFKKYRVEKGIIEFIEPDEQGRISRLELDYEHQALERAGNLLSSVWQSIQSLQFPDTNAYPKTLAGVRQFENDLIAAQNKNTGE
jgi:DNA helicase-2/ATP-dependent DNA helicase PcrA